MSFLCQNEPVNEALITIARQVPHQVGLVKLSKTQLRVLKVINVGEEVTALQISERCDLSLSWASSLLRVLYVKCYLIRSSTSLDYGGVEFRYQRFKL
ncbi:MarR family transcriptional regulator [Vibrio cyclitrophicus]|uniref:MarR family transcriptional regulator n=1 Tax=Vibrio cyclitrophicus TaxID=47951 RepID=UPI000C84FFF4|nr:MarR family transcriptional regulator [Vibrio cyclitrophicus]PMF20348.1 MarR family transcriptional regulator [Vibrio cyclitrophicus]